MKILAIGNSFSQDATTYLHQTAQAQGVEMEVYNLYIGGCPLEKHALNLETNEPAYEAQFNGVPTGRGKYYGGPALLPVGRHHHPAGQP